MSIASSLLLWVPPAVRLVLLLDLRSGKRQRWTNSSRMVASYKAVCFVWHIGQVYSDGLSQSGFLTLCAGSSIRGSLFSAMHDMVTAHGYFGRLLFQYAYFSNSRALHFFLAIWPVVGIWLTALGDLDNGLQSEWLPLQSSPEKHSRYRSEGASSLVTKDP